ncbi:UNKNOWN [Stylonychia lemnae]|uniref:Uncharacterized protein n=1 Tax=Stylonychia lemnae TaxID=5949 RepID=A0A078AJR0_STYLE|nr:UNKNOWN [Stylonychia lemnae]|eukprot:CDW82126.1 UNKNOWN [Stylonychia lemnae]
MDDIYTSRVRTMDELQESLQKFAMQTPRNQRIEVLQLTKQIRSEMSPKKSDNFIRVTKSSDYDEGSHQKMVKRLISSKKFLHSQPEYKNNQESPIKKIEQSDSKKLFLLTSQEDEKDRNMKAAIKFLRNLGQQRRQWMQYQDQMDEISSPSPQTTGFNNDQRLSYKTARNRKSNADLSLLDFQNLKTKIDLNDEERDYIDLTKEYRQYDEKKFEAFQKKYKDQRRSSARVTSLPPFDINQLIGNITNNQQNNIQLEIITNQANNVGLPPLHPENKKIGSLTKLHLIVESHKDDEIDQLNTMFQQEKMELGVPRSQTAKNQSKVHIQLPHQKSINVFSARNDLQIDQISSDSQDESSFGDSDDKTSSQNSIPVKQIKMRDPRMRSFQINNTKTLASLYNQSISKNSFVKSRYSRYIPSKVSVKDFKNPQHLKTLRENLRQLSISVEDGSIQGQNSDEPKSAQARLQKIQNQNKDIFEGHLIPYSINQLLTENKKLFGKISQTTKNQTQRFKSLREDSLKKIVKTINLLSIDVEKRSEEMSQQMLTGSNMDNNSYSFERFQEDHSNFRKQSKCTSEQYQITQRLIDAQFNSQESSISPPNSNDRNSVGNKSYPNRKNTVNNTSNLNNIEKFTIILQQTDCNYQEDQ